MNSGHWSRSFSSDAASVEKPVLVRFCGDRPRSSNRIWRSWIGELRLNSPPGRRVHLAGQPLALRREAFVQPAQLDGVDADARLLHAGQHGDERVLDRRRRAPACPACRARPAAPAPGG